MIRRFPSISTASHFSSCGLFGFSSAAPTTTFSSTSTPPFYISSSLCNRSSCGSSSSWHPTFGAGKNRKCFDLPSHPPAATAASSCCPSRNSSSCSGSTRCGKNCGKRNYNFSVSSNSSSSDSCHIPFCSLEPPVLSCTTTPLLLTLQHSSSRRSLLSSNCIIHPVPCQRRFFYASKWERRLNNLLAPRRFARPSTIPEFETFEAPKADTSDAIPTVEKIKPLWNTRRTGVLAYKMGCISIWDEWGERHPCTVCQIDRCTVLEHRTLDKHGYEGLQLGMGYSGIHKQSKQNIGRYIKLGTGPKHVVKEVKCSSDCFLPVGHQISVRHFVPGQWVFVSGWTRAKGFMGVMKRHGFAGGRASHGTQGKAHSAPGAIGQGHSVNLVWKFKKMAGHHGPDPRVVNCKVMRIEAERNLIYLKGCIPGYTGSVCKISDARGKTWHRNKDIQLHYPTFCPIPGERYPVTVQCPPKEEDPFLYPEVPIYDKE